MLNILRRAELFDFVFGEFNLQNQEIYDVIVNHGDGAMELKFFGKRVYLDPYLVAKVKKKKIEGEKCLTTRKPPS
jgi:hypothetical protein